MIDQYQERLVAAIQYFAKNVKYPSKTKIFKLLFFLDEEHYKQTGLTVTNLDYFAWDFGPVPRKIWCDIKDGQEPDYLKGKIRLMPSYDDEDNESRKIEFRTIGSPNMMAFTPRQVLILENISKIYRDVKPNQISSLSHEKNKPWDVTIQTKGAKQKIDFDIVLSQSDPVTKDEAIQLMKDRSEMITNFPFTSQINAK